ncbi:hypothetical protein [Parvularcula oceani]|uniref:hypothetical protein n=1 Tax=Parvularcula oceani TaxID=1247963 RepID=UPI0004E0CC32|nr:hypothetical protein [Parvularcula oceani]
MTDSPPPSPNLALIKGVTAGLGLLLLGGLALLVVLLFTRGTGGEGAAELAPLTVGPGEAIVDQAVGEDVAMFVIRGEDSARVVFVDIDTGAQKVLPVERALPDDQ